MAFTDRFGLPLSTSSATAAELYVQSIDAALSLNGGTQALIESALAEDEGFALAHIHLARVHQFEGRMAEAQASSRRATEVAAGTTVRERQHVATLAAAVRGDGPGALAMINEHMAEFPADAYVVNQAQGPFGLIGFGGYKDRHEQNIAILELSRDALADDWWFLSAYAFAHNELYHFAEARRLAERSLQINERSGAGAHTMAHVHFETGDAESGVAFLDGWLPGYWRNAQIFSHLTWHQALFELARGNEARVLDLYENELKPGASLAFALNILTDATSLLWREDLDGVKRPSGSREALRDFAATAFGRPGISFADCHCALAYASAGDFAALERLSGQLKDRVAQGKVAAGPVVPALVDAIAAFAREDHASAIALMEPVMDDVLRIGGSNAQREVFEDTLLEAFLRAERFGPAEALIRRRLDRRPSPRDERRLARATTGAPTAAGG